MFDGQRRIGDLAAPVDLKGRTMPARVRIFISYRRDDSSIAATLIAKHLVDRFGDACVFIDIEKTAYGEDLKRVINETLDRCDVLIAVIGPRWSELLQQRPAETEDYVRHEIVYALARGTRVLPVFVGNATATELHAVPDDLAAMKTILALTLDEKYLTLCLTAIVETVEGRRFADIVKDLERRVRSPRRAPWALLAGVHAVWERCKGLLLAAPGTAELPAPITDRVHFTATAPPSVAPGTDFLLQVWGHLEDQRLEVLRRARRLSEGRRIGEKGPLSTPSRHGAPSLSQPDRGS